jgi:hypothetical protein
MAQKTEKENRTESSFRLSNLSAETKKSVRDALKKALTAEIKKDGGKQDPAHSAHHQSNHSSSPEKME